MVEPLTFEKIKQAMKEAGLLEPQYDVMVHPADAPRLRALFARVASDSGAAPAMLMGDYPIIEKDYMVRDVAIFVPRERAAITRRSPFDDARGIRILKISEAEAQL